MAPNLTLDARCRVTIGTLDLDVAITARQREVVAVVGPNGAGKTTLLCALAGLADMRDGMVRLGDRTLADVRRGTWVPPEHRRIGFVFQDYLLFPHLSVLDNVRFGLARNHDSTSHALEWLDRFGVRELASRRPAQLSGGQSQRVALARALARSPELLLLDEPLSAIDAAGRPQLRRDLRHHLESFGGVMVLVTHDAEDAAALADRVLVLEAGRVIREGSAAELLVEVEPLRRKGW